jgi:hypothetical protein
MTFQIGNQLRRGIPSGHTEKAEKGKAALIRAYLENIRPINEALIKKAKEGDIAAIKELHDRVYGRPYQAIGGAGGGALKIETITGMRIVNE